METFRVADEAAEHEPGKRERTKAANRQAILDAARRVFAQLGYEATTVRDIIRGTELASGTFYNYFKSKEEIAEALQDDGARRFRPRLRAAVTQAEGLEDFVRGALRAYFAFVAEEREAQALGMGDLAIGPSHADTPEMQAVFQEIREYIEGVVARGLAPQIDVEYFTAAAIGMAQEVGLRMITRSPHDIEGATQFCARLILSGVAGFAGPTHFER